VLAGLLNARQKRLANLCWRAVKPPASTNHHAQKSPEGPFPGSIYIYIYPLMGTLGTKYYSVPEPTHPRAHTLPSLAPGATCAVFFSLTLVFLPLAVFLPVPGAHVSVSCRQAHPRTEKTAMTASSGTCICFYPHWLAISSTNFSGSEY